MGNPQHNEWDIGSVWIFMYLGVHRDRWLAHGMEHHPMLVPVSGTHGTVNVKTTLRIWHFTIQGLYPIDSCHQVIQQLTTRFNT
jgi:hypothetical protein